MPVPGTADHVISSGTERLAEGLFPFEEYLGIEDPQQALEAALAVKKGQQLHATQHQSRDARARTLLSSGKKYRGFTDPEIKLIAQMIIRTSESEEEIQRRLKDELGYPYGAALTMCTPRDRQGTEARDLVSGLGGLITKNGAMVMGMLHGHNGTILL